MVNRMFQEFNDGTQVQRITTTKKPSICQDDDEQVEEEEEDPYDYHGWESDEFDDDAGDESSSDDEVGEYVEPESEEPARHIKETPVVRKGLVEELRAGIAQSLGREIPSPLKQMKPAPIEQEEHIDDIYDVPPEEDDMYEEPSDSSGNAMVIRPPSMDKTIRTSETEPGEYIEARQRKGSDDELYEQPLEGEEISSPSQGMQRPFIATEVVQPPTISRGLPPQVHSDDMYEIPQSDEPQAEQNYEVPDIEPAPPPRPPKGGGGVQNSNSFTPPRAQPSPNQPAQAPRSSLPSKVPGSSKPCPTANKPVIPAGATNRTGKPPSMAPKPSLGTRPIPGAQPGVRKPTPSPSLSNKEPANPQSDRGPMPFPSNRGAMPSPSSRGPTPSPSNRGAVTSPSSRGPTPSPSNRGAVPSPSSRGPTPSPSNMGAVATPSSRGVASPPSSSHSTQSPTGKGPVRPPSSRGPTPSPANRGPALPPSSRKPTPSPSGKTPASSPANREPLPSPQSKGASRGAPIPSETPLPGPPKPPRASDESPPTPQRRLHREIPPEPVSEPAPPPRPPKQGAAPEPHFSLPSSPGTKTLPSTTPQHPTPQHTPPIRKQTPPSKPHPSPTPAQAPPHSRPVAAKRPMPSTPVQNPCPSEAPPRLPPANKLLPSRKISGGKHGVPLPAPPTSSVSEQSSASSIESGSADEPLIPLPQIVGSHGQRILPPPPAPAKTPLDVMKEAPWFQGAVDRKKAEASLKACKQDGAFLVRNSTRHPNDYSMSLLYKGDVRHLKIPEKDGKYILGDSGLEKFNTIVDLVNYYRQNNVNLKAGGTTRLAVPCPVYVHG
ncbi:basic proline-rich protein isoform X2 [Nematostella vectensis]|nr:basic proline-rich protein isoform X2 [Nematostella vectensis]